MILNITYLFCIKKIFCNHSPKIGFIVESNALSYCIETLAIKEGYDVTNYFNRHSFIFEIIYYKLKYVYRIFRFLYNSFKSKYIALRVLNRPTSINNNTEKIIIVRSWFTEDTINNSKIYKDRNFGQLLNWLRLKNYKILVLPMFFNLSSPLEKVYTYMNSQKTNFIVPEHYLKIVDLV